jgi:hypothetical protein
LSIKDPEWIDKSKYNKGNESNKELTINSLTLYFVCINETNGARLSQSIWLIPATPK